MLQRWTQHLTQRVVILARRRYKPSETFFMSRAHVMDQSLRCLPWTGNGVPGAAHPRYALLTHNPEGIVVVRARGGSGVLMEPNRQWIRGEHGFITSTTMKGSARSMELGAAVDEASRTIDGGENSCRVSTPMLCMEAFYMDGMVRGGPWGNAINRQWQFSSMRYNFIARRERERKIRTQHRTKKCKA
jgi:hypothetical protein